MPKIDLDWLWSKRWYLFSGPIIAGITGFSRVVLGIDLFDWLPIPDWLSFSIGVLLIMLGLISVLLGWIHFFRRDLFRRDT